MLTIGITGGIGSGKTTVCRFFELLEVPVYYADARAKALMVEDETLKAGIISAFGSKSYLENGQVNRTFLADVVFQDEEALEKLNALVHPAVWQDTSQWIQSRMDHHPYVLYEAAILFESGSFKMVDKVITVYAPEDLRIQRVMQRDGVDEDAVRQRMSKQMSDEEKKDRADFVIHNDYSVSLVTQVLDIHKELISLSNS